MDIDRYHFKQETNILQQDSRILNAYRYVEAAFLIVQVKEGTLAQFDRAPELVLSGWDSHYVLFVEAGEEEISLLFFSDSKEIRALEFLGALIPEFGLVKGNAVRSEGKISSVILGVKMSDLEIQEPVTYFLAKTDAYFEKTEVIYADEYGKTNREQICRKKKYAKRREGWAVVKSLTIAAPGDLLCVKTLENESGDQIVAAEDVYIMIGCRGEVYSIERSKFDATYEFSEKPLDVFEKMFDFIPAVENVKTGEYISLDEIARICYPKGKASIYASRLEYSTKVFPVGERKEYFYGRPGDYLATRMDDLCDSYIIQADVFEQTYELFED